MVDKQSIAYISSIDEGGFPNTRTMFSPRVREGIKIFYFTTNTSSIRVHQYLQNKKACIYFSDKRFFRGVMLLGEMEVLQEDRYKEILWEEKDTMYYPQGVHDPNYCVLRFTAHKGRFYSAFKSETFEIQ